MSMKPIVTAATLIAVSAGVLPAADAQLLGLVMPDAKVLAGVNVRQAKGSPLGQFLLNQLQAQNQQLQQLTTLTGFDPTRDVDEVLVASNGAPGGKSGLALARGTFDTSKIPALIQMGGGSTESYHGATLLEDPMKMNAVVFLNASLAAAGDIASVKGAVDRQSSPTTLSAAILSQVSQWSGTEDAWVVDTVPPGSLQPAIAAGAPNPGLQNALQSIQQSAGGVTLGTEIALTATAQADTPDNATSLANVLKFVINLAQMQAQQKDPQVVSILKSLTIQATGNMVNVSLNIPETTVEQVLNAKPGTATPQSTRRPARRL